MNRIATTLIFLLLFSTACSFPAKTELKLYAIDCGTIEVSDMASFDKAGRMNGKSEVLANPCFLIKHNDDYMIWDTGHPSSLADQPTNDESGVFKSKLQTTLKDQLSRLSLKPEDIKIVGLSHLHPDHAGNANLFKKSSWIVSRLAHEYMFATNQMANVEFSKHYKDLESAKTIKFKSEHDVFGDGRVKIISTPGHTPGHSVLLLKLKNSGSILLTGDLFTHENARKLSTVPVFTMDEKKLKESRTLFERIAKENDARVVIQHSRKDFESLPKYPAFLN